MIQGIKGSGVNRANAICDGCGRCETVPCGYHATGPRTSSPDEAQVQKKLTTKGWAASKKKLLCPTCEAKRKAATATPPSPAKEPAMTTAVAMKAPDLRRPSPAQKRQIIGLLEDAYDDDSKRYRNPTDTDKTLADVIGGGCMWGWVAEIREELFGPDTRNAEVEALRADVKRIEGQIGNLTGEARKLDEALAEIRDRLGKVA